MKNIVLNAITHVSSLFRATLPAGRDHEKEPAHECTSWMVFSDLTGNNTNILHKNRDASARNIMISLSSPGAKRQWIALGSGTGANMGINGSGLAGVMNSGEKCIDHSTNESGKTTPEIMQVILESCDTAAQAVEKLQEFIKVDDYWHKERGSTFFFLDPDEGFICEMTAKICLPQRYDRGYAVRANIWQNPSAQLYSRCPIEHYLDSSARAYIAFSSLNNALDDHGRITLADIFDLSRHCKMPEQSKEKRSVCFTSTNSTASLEIDRQYPGILSTAYVTIGHPRHTVYIPVPVCTREIYPVMGDGRWSAAAWARYNELSLEAPIPAEWATFEDDFLKKYSAAKEDARKLLDHGKKDEAISLINSTAAEIWDEAIKLMKLDK